MTEYKQVAKAKRTYSVIIGPIIHFFLANLVNFDHFCEKTKWRPDQKWFVTWKNKHQIRAQEVWGILKNIFLFDFDLF